MQIQDKIRELRLNAKMTQKELADKLGVQRNTITQYEAGRISPPVNNIMKLSRIFSVTPEYFLNDNLSNDKLDIESLTRLTMGDSYSDSIIRLTAKKLTENFIKENKNEFLDANHNLLYRMIEANLYFNMIAKKEGKEDFTIELINKSDKYSVLNSKIRDFTNQLISVERLKKIVDNN